MLTVDRKALARALKIVGPAVAKTSHIPALFGVHLVAGESALHLTASNLDLTIGTVLDAEMDDEPFEVIASAATLGRILAAGRCGRRRIVAGTGHAPVDRRSARTPARGAGR